METMTAPSAIHPLGNTLLRTPEMFDSYQSKPRHEDCFICAAPAIKQWVNWKLIANDFPYDAVAEKHFMLVPLRHVAEEKDITETEYFDLNLIRTTGFLDDFDCIIDNLPRGRTVPSHYHLHIIQWKRA